MSLRRWCIAGALVFGIAVAGCSKEPAGLEIPTGSQITVQKKDGTSVRGRLLTVQADKVVVEGAQSVRTEVLRSDIASAGISFPADTGTSASTAKAAAEKADSPQPAPAVAAKGPREPAAGPATAPADTSARPAPGEAELKRAEQKRSPAPPSPPVGPGVSGQTAAPRAEPVPAFREVTIPAGTALPIELRTSVASDTSHVEDSVQASLALDVSIGGVEALPAGTRLRGHVTEVTRSGRVKGRARLAMRFNGIDLPGEGGRMVIRTTVIAREAEGTQKKDAAKVGGGAAGGAIIGGILGGGSGAAKGAVIGGAAGTGVVLSTRGKEVRLDAGTPLSIKLLEPIKVRVRTSGE
jgi:hypothetical protein